MIETPELDQQLAQSKADLVSAQSNASLAKVTAERYQGLMKQNAVSQQDTDNAVAQLQAREAAVTSAEANVKRLEQMVSFERVVAPFDGVVTARNLDVGQLVGNSGSTTTAGAGTISGNKPMFEISDLQKSAGVRQCSADQFAGCQDGRIGDADSAAVSRRNIPRENWFGRRTRSIRRRVRCWRRLRWTTAMASCCREVTRRFT